MNSRNIRILTVLLSILLLVVGCSSAEAVGLNQPAASVATVSKELKVHYINVGQADSIFIDYQDYDILIDGGNNLDGGLVVNYLKNLSVDDIEILVGTHAHEDHIGGLDNVLAAFNVEQIISTESIEGVLEKSDKITLAYKEYINAAVNEKNTAGAKLIEDSNLTFNLDEGIDFKVIELGDDFKDVNNTSIVCILDYNDTEFLFMGDLESDVEKANLDKFSDIEVLKLGHHGSRTSTSKEFLDVVKPEYGIFSCGMDNSYGHPHAETIVKLNEYGIKSFRTDHQGNIVATTDGKSVSFNVEPMKLEVMKESNASNVTNSSSQDYNNDSSATQTKIAETKVTEKKSKTVYITDTGKKYHSDGCRYLKKSKIPISLDNAKARGYGACKVCKP